MLSFFFTGEIPIAYLGVTAKTVAPGSKATKYKASYKARLEEQDGHTSSCPSSSSISQKRDTSAGNRDHLQVICNGFPGTLACVLWIARFGDAFGFVQGRNVGKLATICPLTTTAEGLASDNATVSNVLIYAAVG